MKSLSLMLCCLFLFQTDAESAKKTIKFGTIAPSNTPWSDTLDQFKKKLDQESKGSIEAKLYLGGQLGGEIEILQGIRRGRIDGGGLTTSALASVVPELDLLEIPYLFESNEEADFVLDQVMYEPYKKLLAEKGLVLLLWSENGWRSIGTKSKEIKSPSDLKSLKVRSQESKTHLEFWKSLEANPIAIAVPEVLPALQTGVVAGFDNTPLFTMAAEWNTAIKHYTTTEHIYQPGAIVYSKSQFDKLSSEEKTAIESSTKDLASKSRVAVRALGKQLIDLLKESGVKVVTLTDSEKAAFKTATRNVGQEVIKKLGGKSQEFFNIIQDGKKKFAEQKSKKKS